MKELIITSAVFFISLLTLYSGFGLGTMLMPIMALFFPVTTAIVLTALIHLLNNFIKISMLWDNIRWNIVFRFGIPAMTAAACGALLLTQLGNITTIYSYTIFGMTAAITPIKFIVGFLLLFFATLESFPNLRKKIFNLTLPISGLLSGFFGGLSGHQGAFRSAFLINANLNESQFIATGSAISILIDITRLIVYGLNITLLLSSISIQFILLIIAASFAGLFVGKMYLKHITIKIVRIIIAIMLYIFGILLIMGLI